MRNYDKRVITHCNSLKLQGDIITSRLFSSRRCLSLCRSISAIISFSINLFASSTLLATSISISSFRFSNSSSTRFLTSNSILLAASSSTTYDIKKKKVKHSQFTFTLINLNKILTFCSASLSLLCLSMSANLSTSSMCVRGVLGGLVL